MQTHTRTNTRMASACDLYAHTHTPFYVVLSNNVPVHAHSALGYGCRLCKETQSTLSEITRAYVVRSVACWRFHPYTVVRKSYGTRKTKSKEEEIKSSIEKL